MEKNENPKLLIVEDSFVIEDRGLVVMPFISDYSGPMSFSVLLRKPDGEESKGKAQLEHVLINSAVPNEAFACIFTGVDKQDVPIGTEVWILTS